MIVIAGIILGIVMGIWRGRQLSEDRKDRLMYIGSFGLAGFTLGLIITTLIQLIFG